MILQLWAAGGATLLAVRDRFDRIAFAYIAGGSSLVACDTTVEPGDAFVSAVDAGAAPSAVATTADGNEVALEHGSKTLMASRIVDAIVAFLHTSGG